MVIFASIAAMLCKTLIDFIGNRTARKSKGRSVSSYYMIQSLTMVIILGLLIIIGLFELKLDIRSVLFGVSIGTFSYIAYFLFLTSLKSQNGTINTTIYRLNFITSSILGVVVLNESITWQKTVGILLCVAAIIIFVNIQDLRSGKAFDIYMLYSLLANVLTGILNITSKVALNEGISSDTLLTIRYIVVALITVVLYRIPGRGKEKENLISMKEILIPGAISGVLMLTSLYLLYYALSIGEITIVMPIVQSCFVFTFVLCVIFLKEKLNLRKIIGIGLAVAAMIVFSL